MDSQNRPKKPVGYSFVLNFLEEQGLKPLRPYSLCYVLEKGENAEIVRGSATIKLYKKRYWPGESIWDHLAFALKHEDLNLGLLKMVFEQMSIQSVIEFVSTNKSQKYTRLIWFFFEWLLEKKLEIEDVKKESYFKVLDPEVYFAATPVRLKRYNIENNLLGNAQFCPIVRKTKKLKKCSSQKIRDSVIEIVDGFDSRLLERAASFLYAKETKSSFEIEKENPDKTRSARFIHLLKKADQDSEITKKRLIAWQNTIMDSRFAESDYRKSQNYVGETLLSGLEHIHYISPKPEELEQLMEGMLFAYRNMIQSQVDPVIVAAITSFAFVYIHPFEDGNGRIHRFLLHKILSSQKVTPKGVMFPVSSTMLNNMNEYDRCLESFSDRILELIEYEIDNDGVMTVQQPTMYYYQFMDFSEISEYLFDCIDKTIEVEFRQEVEYLEMHDMAKNLMSSVVDMPDRHVDNFIRSVFSNQGILSKRIRKKFDFLTDTEAENLRSIVADIFKLS